MVFDGPKPLKSIEKQTLFLILGHSKKQWKNDAKGDLKSHVLGSKMATWASQVRLILWFWTFWCDAEKSSFLDALQMDQQIEKIEPWSNKGSPRWLRESSGWKFLGHRGPYTVRKTDRFDSKTATQEKKSRHAVGPKARRIQIIIKKVQLCACTCIFACACTYLS